MSKRFGRSRSRLSRSRTGLNASRPRPTGTLMKKIHSQPSSEVIGPPTSHAAVAPTPPIVAHTPRALLRSEPSSNVVIRIDSAVGVMIAAATPWITRAAIRDTSDHARPHPSEASANRAGADHEHAPPTEQVRGAAAQQQQTAEAQQIGTQDPLQRSGREPEVLLDRRQGHDHDRRVEDDHEERGAQQRERLPAPRIGTSAHASTDRRTSPNWAVVGRGSGRELGGQAEAGEDLRADEGRYLDDAPIVDGEDVEDLRDVPRAVPIPDVAPDRRLAVRAGRQVTPALAEGTVEQEPGDRLVA